MMWGNDDGRWNMHEQSGAGWVMMLIFVIAVVVAVVALLRGQTHPASTPGVRSAGAVVDARQILQERFARGDIDEQDFRARIKALHDTAN